jgi:hypothetical protein
VDDGRGSKISSQRYDPVCASRQNPLAIAGDRGALEGRIHADLRDLPFGLPTVASVTASSSGRCESSPNGRRVTLIYQCRSRRSR